MCPIWANLRRNYDEETDELFSHAALGDLRHEIRFSAKKGIAGSVYRSGRSVFIADAYSDPRFLPEIDEQTGYLTRSVLCVPLKNWDGRIIGATEVLNKLDGEFDDEDRPTGVDGDAVESGPRAPGVLLR